MNGLKSVRYFALTCLLSVTPLAQLAAVWPWSKPQPTIREQVVKAIRKYPVETGLVVAPVATALYWGCNSYKSKPQARLVGDAKKRSKAQARTRRNQLYAVGGLLTLGAGAYIASKKGYIPTAKIKSLVKIGVDKTASFVHAHKKALLAAEGLGAAFWIGRDTGVFSSIANWYKSYTTPAKDKFPAIPANVMGLVNTLVTTEVADVNDVINQLSRDENLDEFARLLTQVQEAVGKHPILGQGENRAAIAARRVAADGVLTRVTGKIYQDLQVKTK